MTLDRRLERLRAAIADGEEGEAVPWTPELMEQLTREAEEMLRRGEMPDPDVCPWESRLGTRPRAQASA